MKSDRFLIDLRPAMRVFNKELFFTARDSIINRLDSITITKAGPSENFFDSALKIIGAIAIGFLLGKTL